MTEIELLREIKKAGKLELIQWIKDHIREVGKNVESGKIKPDHPRYQYHQSICMLLIDIDNHINPGFFTEEPERIIEAHTNSIDKI